MKLSELIGIAIKSEEDSYNFYMDALKIAKYPNVIEVLEMLAKEELSHKKLLESMESGNEIKTQEFMDLKLSDHLPLKDKIDENSTLQDVLKVAMSREKKEYNFYSELMKKTKDEGIIKTLKFIANQELNHKAKLENIYDELFYKEF